MQPLLLTKGQRIDLTKGNQGLSVVNFALGWDERKKATPTEEDFDPDASAIVLHSSKAWENPSDLLYYNSNKDAGQQWVDKTKPYPFIMDGALRSSGDERTGGKEGDDEVITVDLSKLNPDVSHVALIVTIYEVDARKQNFGMMNNAYCRIEAPGIDSFKPQKADLTEDYSAYTALIMGYLYRKDGDWKYNAAMKGINKDTLGADGKPLGSVDLGTIAVNLTAILDIKATATA
jgi:tellurium resistance protein TerD